MYTSSTGRRSALVFLGLGGLAVLAHAQSPSPELHPWQAALPRLTAEAYITNLHDGDKIETPFLLKFGLSGGWGLAPIAKPARAKSGHHHLLVNRTLPLNFTEALPFNDQYIHFGKGQMETVLTLAPGTYTLRMLLANDKHLPHFVYSKPMTITVTQKTSTDPKSLSVKGIAVSVAGPVVNPPFRVRFHASALNVAHVAQQVADTGHFKLTAIPKDPSKSVEFDFTEGQTEVWLAPPLGDYTLKLEFLDNMNPAKALMAPVSTTVKVQ
jgi:Domain of unknown function (DUF4399)